MTDTQQLFTDAFLAEIEDRKKRDGAYDPTEWTAGGRASKAWPKKEDASWWLTEGPKMVDSWCKWWSTMKTEGWTLWRTPQGVPAIELEVFAEIGGQRFRCFIDAVFVDGDGDLVCIDWKSGREPTAPIQLGSYALAMEKTLGARPKLGAFYLARKGDLGHVYDLSIYTEDVVGPWLQRAAEIEKQGLFIPHPSSLCSACSVREWCLIMGGAKADQVPSF